MVFFDTTSLYFEGEGGETIGQLSHNKDHRPDLKQMGAENAAGRKYGRCENLAPIDQEAAQPVSCWSGLHRLRPGNDQ